MSETPDDVRPKSNGRILDESLYLHKSSSAITSTADGAVDGTDTILDLGKGEFRADMVVDISALDLADGDELYRVFWQLSNSATFADTIVTPVGIELGSAAGGERSAASTTGRYIQPVTNVYNDVHYRYGRLRIKVVTGTTPSITIDQAYLSKR